jgi:hypothetical protein
MPKQEQVFPWVCWLISAYFAIGIISTVGFPPSGIRAQWPMIAAFGFFFVLPFVSKIDLFQIVSVERKLTEVKEKVDDTKEKVKEVQGSIAQMLVAQQTLSNSIQTLSIAASASNSSSNVNVSVGAPLPDMVIEAAKAEMKGIQVPSTTDAAIDKTLDSIVGPESPLKTIRNPAAKLHAVGEELLTSLRKLVLSVFPERRRDVDLRWWWLTAVAIDESLRAYGTGFEVFNTSLDRVQRNEPQTLKSIDDAYYIGVRLVSAVNEANAKMTTAGG